MRNAILRNHLNSSSHARFDYLWFPALGSAWRLSLIFPRLAGVACFPALGTGHRFSLACGWLHIFPRLSSFRGWGFVYYALSVFSICGFILLFQIQVGGRSIVCSDVQQNVVCVGIWYSFVFSFVYKLFVLHRVFRQVLCFNEKTEPSGAIRFLYH